VSDAVVADDCVCFVQQLYRLIYFVRLEVPELFGVNVDRSDAVDLGRVFDKPVRLAVEQ
jgi:hypothetical protein